MTLQKKTLAAICLTTVTLIVVLYAASQVIVLGSFSAQEDQDTRQNVERVQSALADNLQSLEGTTRDWSIWDDTYAYIQDKTPAYFDSNLSNEAPMTSNRLNLMLFIDSRGNTVFEKSFDYRNAKLLPAPAGLHEQLYKGSSLLTLQSPESSIKGILALPEAPMLIASEPILPSAGSGPIRGTLIFGRFLDTDEIQHLAKTTLLGLTLHPVNDPQMPGDVKQAMALMSEAQSIQVRPLDATSIAGYALLKDVYGKPALMLKADMPRNVYARGQNTVSYYMLTLVGAGLVFATVVLLLLRRMVLSRLARLNKDVSSIAASTDMSSRVMMPGKDELGHLAGSINGMLSALERSQEKLKEGEERYRAVVEQTTEAIFLVDAETHRFIQANAASQNLLGYTQEELSEMTLDEIIEPGGERRASKSYDTTGALRLAVERGYRRKNGSTVYLEMTDSHIAYGGRDVLCIVARDVTDRKRAEAVLRDLAMRDGLTGLYNRREMQRILKETVESHEQNGQPTSLVMLDLDHFKSVNDTYGHQVGDDVLRWVGHLLSEMTRAEDIVARYGGEEFAIIMPGADTQVAVEIAERMRRALSAQPFEFVQACNASEPQTERKAMIPLTISLGVASLPEDALTEEALVQAADRALYEAKRNGRNCIMVPTRVRPFLHAVS